jgi:hypothetical protein
MGFKPSNSVTYGNLGLQKGMILKYPSLIYTIIGEIATEKFASRKFYFYHDPQIDWDGETYGI